MMNEFNDLVLDYKNFMLDDPIAATEMGDFSKDFDLPDLSKEKIFSDLEVCKALLRRAKRIKLKDLKFDCQIDLKLMKLALERDVFMTELKYNNLHDFEQKPCLGGCVINSVMPLFLKDSRSVNSRLNRILARFEKMPEMIKSYEGVLKKVNSRWLAIEIEEIKHSPDLFKNIENWAKKEKYSKLKELKKAIKVVNLELKDYLDNLMKLKTVNSFHLKDDEVSNLIKLNGIDLSKDKIFAAAKEFLEKNNKLLDELRLKIINKYPKLKESDDYHTVLSFVKKQFSLPIDKVVPTYKKEQRDIMKFLKSKNLFVFAKSDKLNIMQTPDYLKPTIPVGAMFPSSPFSKGPKTSMIYLTIDKQRAKDQNSLMIKNTMIHEGIPGHHLQFAVGYENGSIVRNLANYNTHAEGWTTYLEEFMTDTGFIDKEIMDEYRFIGHSDLARLAARVSIDLYFLTKDEKYLGLVEGFKPKGRTVFDKAKSLLIQVTGFTPARADGELNWYSRERDRKSVV